MAIIKKKQFIESDAIIKALADIRNEIDLLKKSSVELQQATRDINKTGSGKEAKERITLTQKLQQNTVKLTNVQRQRLKLSKQLQDVQTKRIVSSGKNSKLLAQERVKQQQINKELKQGARELLGLVDATEKLNRARTKAQRNLKNQIILFGENSKQAKIARQEFNRLENQFQKVNAAAKDGRPNVGRYSLALKGVGAQLLGAAGLTAGFAAVGTAINNFSDRANELIRINRQIVQQFGVTNKEAKELSSTVLALANNFDEDYNEILKAANTVSKEFGIEAGRALELVEEGLRKGSNNSGEFIDILKEYPVQFQKAGLSAEESFALINQQVTAGVFSDKGIDAIKEGAIQLTEWTKAVDASLTPLGENIKLEVQRLAATGNTFEAMQLISRALRENNLTASQTQAIMSTVFRGAGEDAESFVLNLDQVQLSLEGVAEQTTEAQNANIRLSESYNNFVQSVEDGSGIISQAWAGLLESLSSVLEGFTALNDETATNEERTEGVVNVLRAANPALLLFGDRLQGITNKLVELLPGLRDLGVRVANFLGLLKGKTIEESNKALFENFKVTRQAASAVDDLAKNNDKLVTSEINLAKVERERQAQLQKRIRLQNQTLALQQRQIQLSDQEIDRDPALQLEDVAKATEEEVDLQARIRQNAREKELEEQRPILEAQAQLRQTAEEGFIQFSKDLLSARADERLAEVTSENEAQREILEQQLRDGLITEEKFAQETKKINNRQRAEEVKAEKKKALFDIAINTAVAIIKAFARGGIVAAGIAAATGAVQAALVAARPVPAFKQGGPVGGKLHSEGGTLIEAERGEYVVNRQGTANAPLALEAINNGILNDRDIASYPVVSEKMQQSNIDISELLIAQNQTNMLLSNLGFPIPEGRSTIRMATGKTWIKNGG